MFVAISFLCRLSNHLCGHIQRKENQPIFSNLNASLFFFYGIEGSLPISDLMPLRNTYPFFSIFPAPTSPRQPVMRNHHLTTALFAFLLPLLLTATSAADNTTTTTAPMERSELEALYSVIQGFVGKWWDGKQLYPDPCGWTAIQGVSCDYFDGQWYITSLSFGPVLENSLACSHDADFTSDLFQLKHLRSLSFFSCFTSPVHHPITIPLQNWENLAGTLETLEFRSNPGLVGHLPLSLGRLTTLRSLVAVDSGLTGPLPPELGNLLHLQRLVLASNNFSGPVPASLGRGLNELLILDLGGNSLAGPIPPSIGGLPSLLKLDLSRNLIEGGLPEEIGNLKSLTLLDVSRNRLTGGLPAALQGLVSLEVMLLSNNPLGGNIMGFPWESLRNLTALDLSNTMLVGSIPESIAGLQELRFIALDGNRLVGSVPPKLAALPSIGAMYLNENNLTGAMEFDGEFYERMGKRFAAWGNPYLCYNSNGVMDAGRGVPVGVDQCKPGQYGSDSTRVGGGGADQSSVASSGIDGLLLAVVVLLGSVFFVGCF